MKFSLIFENSNDSIEFDVVNNADLFEYFVNQCNKTHNNQFSEDQRVSRTVSRLLDEIHHNLTLTNSILPALGYQTFQENNNVLEYLDQHHLNRQHADWVASQQHEINIDQLRFSNNSEVSAVGWKLHNLYPDQIRTIKLAEAMQKLGFIFPYEEVNMTVHRLEVFFSKNIEFKSKNKWNVFDNVFIDSMISNNDVVNFSFGYTYVGRQHYNKWQFWDTDLEFADHYNYETLEYAFQINLDRPQTVPYSPEFLQWCQTKQVKPISCQIPIANVVDLEKNLKYYRTMLYNNSKAKNQATLTIH
jgi:hypothetical protein